MITDSGATCNVVSRDTWEDLETKKIKFKNSPSKKKLYPYGSRTPLEVCGTFWADTEFNNQGVENAEFVVMEGRGQSLSCCNTATKLGALKTIRQKEEYKLQDKQEMLKKFPKLFSGTRKLKDSVRNSNSQDNST